MGDNLNVGGISFDQLIAQHKGQDTPFDSLHYVMKRVNAGISVLQALPDYTVLQFPGKALPCLAPKK